MQRLIHFGNAIAYVSRQRKSHEMRCTDSGNPGGECQVRESFRRYFDIYRDDRGLLTNCARNRVFGVKENVQILMGEVHKFKFSIHLGGSKDDFLASCYEY